MEVVSYNSELAIANLLFKRIFSNIIITRTNTQTGEKTPVSVMCILDQRSRIIKGWENSERRSTYRLPLICISRTGYSRNSERVNNINNDVKYETTSKNRNENLLTPVPIDITYEVSIVAKYPTDIDQIASNFMVFFNNDIFVSCEHPKYAGVKMNNQIIMDDSISEEHSSELDDTTDDFITATFNFTFKTYLFGGTSQAKLVPTKIPVKVLSSVMSEDIVVFKNKYDIYNYLNENTHDKKLSALIEFTTHDEISAFLDKFDGKCTLSTTLTSIVNKEVTILSTNPYLSSSIYDGLTPVINEIQFKFYTTPQSSAFIENMNTVDSYPLSVRHYYVDSMNWKINTITDFPVL